MHHLLLLFALKICVARSKTHSESEKFAWVVPGIVLTWDAELLTQATS